MEPEHMKKVDQYQQNEMDRLRQSNAELLEACKDAFEVISKDYSECVGLLGILELAIAKAEVKS